MSKDIVRSRLQLGLYTLKDKKNVKNFEIWRNFKTVCDAKSDVYVNFVQCVKCHGLYYL